MLAEWITFLTTPCPRPVRRMGYLRELIGTRSRYRRCRDAWRPHLDNTRQTILAAALSAPLHRKATVLGSGLLLDIPLAELAETFGEVVLVDILHLRSTRRAASRFANVRLIEADLSDTLSHLVRATGGDLSSLMPTDTPLPETEDADLVVSANLLTQLPFLPCRWLRQRHAMPDTVADALARNLIRRHLRALARLPGRVCLISEVEHQLCLGSDIVECVDPLYGIDIGPIMREWLWDIAPRPEIDRRYDLRYRVVATAGPAAT